MWALFITSLSFGLVAFCLWGFIDKLQLLGKAPAQRIPFALHALSLQPLFYMLQFYMFYSTDYDLPGIAWLTLILNMASLMVNMHLRHRHPVYPALAVLAAMGAGWDLLFLTYRIVGV